jgi:hypothetical protein
MKRRAFYTLIFTASLMLLFSCKKDNTDPPDPGTLQLVKVRAGNLQLTPGQNTGSIPVNSIFYFEFSGVLDTASARQSISISESGGTESVGLGFSKFPPISDEDLLTLVQQQTFKYFWDFAHPVSGLARERNNSGDLVTIGGSGFGVMAILVGIERGFITRLEGVNRLAQIVDFLTTADRFHGVWPHWMNGNTGQTIPFSAKDNGGDLVETSFMAAGLLTVRQYLDPNADIEGLLYDKINICSMKSNGRGTRVVDKTYCTGTGRQTYGWDMNMQVRGYNEALITYFMAATSTTFPVEATVYHQGWARSGNIVNGKNFYGIPLPVGYDYGGPLFFAHYSFLGLNPTNLSDQYANYWTQNRNHTLINRQHCIVNPFNHIGYSADSWGLTASDNPWGYLAHEPTPARDNGTITPHCCPVINAIHTGRIHAGFAPFLLYSRR